MHQLRKFTVSVHCILMVRLCFVCDKVSTLSNPLEVNSFPRQSPIPANSIADFSPIGSETKQRHTSNVFDIMAFDSGKLIFELFSIVESEMEIIL